MAKEPDHPNISPMVQPPLVPVFFIVLAYSLGRFVPTPFTMPLALRYFGLALTFIGFLLGIGAFISEASGRRKRYAHVGVGSRSGMYRDAILDAYSAHSELVGFCDNNAGRLKLAQEHAQAKCGKLLPAYAPDKFDRMIRETRPDVVIVTTKDATHDHYIVRAMELGCDVTTEKPLATDEKKCRAIVETQRRTGRRCTVTFNYRYSPPRTQVKDMLMSGLIGDVLSVDFHWLLDTHHGADYFRRWHSNKVNSGGLMVHKATPADGLPRRNTSWIRKPGVHRIALLPWRNSCPNLTAAGPNRSCGRTAKTMALVLLDFLNPEPRT